MSKKLGSLWPVASRALFGSLNGVTDADICHICKHPVAGIGSPICSALHLASRFKCRIDQLEDAIRNAVIRLEAHADGYAETREAIADLAAILLPNDLAQTRRADARIQQDG